MHAEAVEDKFQAHGEVPFETGGSHPEHKCEPREGDQRRPAGMLSSLELARTWTTTAGMSSSKKSGRMDRVRGIGARPEKESVLSRIWAEHPSECVGSTATREGLKQARTRK